MRGNWGIVEGEELRKCCLRLARVFYSVIAAWDITVGVVGEWLKCRHIDWGSNSHLGIQIRCSQSYFRLDSDMWGHWVDGSGNRIRGGAISLSIRSFQGNHHVSNIGSINAGTREIDGFGSLGKNDAFGMTGSQSGTRRYNLVYNCKMERSSGGGIDRSERGLDVDI